MSKHTYPYHYPVVLEVDQDGCDNDHVRHVPHHSHCYKPVKPVSQDHGCHDHHGYYHDHHHHDHYGNMPPKSGHCHNPAGDHHTYYEVKDGSYKDCNGNALEPCANIALCGDLGGSFMSEMLENNLVLNFRNGTSTRFKLDPSLFDYSGVPVDDACLAFENCE